MNTGHASFCLNKQVFIPKKEHDQDNLNWKGDERYSKLDSSGSTDIFSVAEDANMMIVLDQINWKVFSVTFNVLNLRFSNFT